MIITFIGHSFLGENLNLDNKIKFEILKNVKENEKVNFYCGGYGAFDELCRRVCRNLQKENENFEVVFVTPYITPSQQKKIDDYLLNGLYDSVMYPELENTPMRFAIIKRNKWMIEHADLIIAYVEYEYGGAYNALKYAYQKGKAVINLGGV